MRPLGMPLSRAGWIDKDFTDEESMPKVRLLGGISEIRLTY